jgi:hypothetical protein
MTETPTLAQRLRATWPNAISDPDSRHLEAADALESQAAQIAEQAAKIEALRDALALAVRQNEHDMLMTGEELRACRAALLTGLPTIGAAMAAKEPR